MHSITVRRVISAILLPLYLSSCTSWQMPTVSPEQTITEDQPSKVRVTLNDSSLVEMEQPRIVGDTLRGVVKSEAADSLVERDVLLTDIATLEVSQKDRTKSILLGVGIAVAVVAVVAVVGYIVVCEDTVC